MNTLRQVKGIVPLAGAALVIIAIAFFVIGRVTSPPAAKTVAPTPTRVIPTATPNLVLRSPHVLGVLLVSSVVAGGPSCSSCTSLTFAANGPFVVIASCNPFGSFGDAPLSYQIQLFNTGGHLLDTVQQSCGNPTTDKAATTVIPENLSAGQYQVQLSIGASMPVSVVILDASPQ
jgi:hypothetical protein